MEFPFPSIDVQQQIVAEFEDITKEINMATDSILKIQEGIKSKFLEMFGTPIDNKHNWECGTIRDIVTEVKYGTSSPATANGQYPYLRMNNITYDGKLDISDLKYIDMPDDELEKYIVRKGDVLFNRTNSPELVGKTCVYDRDEPMIIAGYIIRVRLNDRGNPLYLSALMNSEYGKTKLFSICRKSVNQANINAQDLQNIEILIPPIKMQNEFAKFCIESYADIVIHQKALDEATKKRDGVLSQYL